MQTIGTIAKALRAPRWKIRRCLRRRGIVPIAKLPKVWLYDDWVLDEARKEISRMLRVRKKPRGDTRDSGGPSQECVSRETLGAGEAVPATSCSSPGDEPEEHCDLPCVPEAS